MKKILLAFSVISFIAFLVGLFYSILPYSINASFSYLQKDFLAFLAFFIYFGTLIVPFILYKEIFLQEEKLNIYDVGEDVMLSIGFSLLFSFFILSLSGEDLLSSIFGLFIIAPQLFLPIFLLRLYLKSKTYSLLNSSSVKISIFIYLLSSIGMSCFISVYSSQESIKNQIVIKNVLKEYGYILNLEMGKELDLQNLALLKTRKVPINNDLGLCNGGTLVRVTLPVFNAGYTEFSYSKSLSEKIYKYDTEKGHIYGAVVLLLNGKVFYKKISYATRDIENSFLEEYDENIIQKANGDKDILFCGSQLSRSYLSEVLVGRF